MSRRTSRRGCPPWLPVSERMTQRSSAQVLMCGNSSLTGKPHLPAGVNLNCGARSVLPLVYFFPASAASLGLGSNVSRCETPPVMKR